MLLATETETAVTLAGTLAASEEGSALVGGILFFAFIVICGFVYLRPPRCRHCGRCRSCGHRR